MDLLNLCVFRFRLLLALLDFEDFVGLAGCAMMVMTFFGLVGPEVGTNRPGGGLRAAAPPGAALGRAAGGGLGARPARRVAVLPARRPARGCLLLRARRRSLRRSPARLNRGNVKLSWRPWAAPTFYVNVILS